jgi:hypothetical protein
MTPNHKIGIWTVAVVCALPVVYYLSLGPVGWLCARGILPNEPFQSFYRELVVEDICGASRYYDWWVRPQPVYCGGTDGETSASATDTNK